MKNKIIRKLETIFPMGLDYIKEIQWLLAGLIISIIYSLRYIIILISNYNNLFEYAISSKKRILKDGAIMDDYVSLIDGSFIIFIILGICIITLCLYHYAHHFTNSKSIYLMKRLPKKFELLKRCILSPVISLIVMLLVILILIIFYYWLYMIITPKQCIAPGQWQKIWTNIL